MDKFQSGFKRPGFYSVFNQTLRKLWKNRRTNTIPHPPQAWLFRQSLSAIFNLSCSFLVTSPFQGYLLVHYVCLTSSLFSEELECSRELRFIGIFIISLLCSRFSLFCKCLFCCLPASFMLNSLFGESWGHFTRCPLHRNWLTRMRFNILPTLLSTQGEKASLWIYISEFQWMRRV